MSCWRRTGRGYGHRGFNCCKRVCARALRHLSQTACSRRRSPGVQTGIRLLLRERDLFPDLPGPLKQTLSPGERTVGAVQNFQPSRRKAEEPEGIRHPQRLQRLIAGMEGVLGDSDWQISYLDDAHGIDALGKTGRGTLEHYGLLGDAEGSVEGDSLGHVEGASLGVVLRERGERRP